MTTIERAWDFGLMRARRRYLNAQTRADKLRSKAEDPSGSMLDLARYAAASEQQDDALIGLAVTAKLAGGEW